MTPVTDFRFRLQQELVRRCEVNPRYSLRSLAKSLNVAPSALSSILNGKRPITRKMKLRVGLRLGWHPEDFLLDETKKQKFNPKKGVRAYTQIRLDSLSFISEWYYDAILELVNLPGFTPTPKNIATRLGLTKSEVNIAVERLERLGILSISKEGKWLDLSKGFSTTLSDSETSIAAVKHQMELLKKSQEALTNIPLDIRSHTGMTFSMSTQKMNEAKELIRDFRREFAAILKKEETPTPDQVYQLQVSLFPLTQTEKNKEVKKK